MNDVLTLLAILHEHNLVIPTMGTIERSALEQHLQDFLDKANNEAYARGWDRGYDSAGF